MANASERQLQKQIGIIKRYSEIGKTASFETDYQFLEPITRTIDDVQIATGKIEQGHKKRHYALFWMVKTTQFDDIAFNYLNEDNTDKAIYIWKKTLKSKATELNYSSYLNLSTLYAALSIKNSTIDLPMLQRSFEIKSQVLNCECLKLFSELISTNSKSVDATEISKQFVDETYEWLKPYIDKPQGITIKDFTSLFTSYPENIRTYLSNRFTETPLSNIETNIDKTKLLRNAAPEDAQNFALALYDKIIDDLKKVKSILGIANIQYQMLANKVANEILQCAIDFFNENRKDDDSKFDPGDETLDLCILAQSIGVTGQLIKRIEENKEVIQEWVDSKSERETYKKIEKNIHFIANKLKVFQNRQPSISTATNLIQQCKQPLYLIKLVTGNANGTYIEINDAVINSAIGMIVDVVNNAQEKFDSDSLDSISATFIQAINLVEAISNTDMSKSARERLNINKTTMVSVHNQINEAIKKKNSGCYIATMAYGSYEHPQVQILRNYRDNTLANSTLGRAFIKYYYVISPHFVVMLKGHHRINKLIRYLLNIFIRSLKNV
jgi:sulfur transfer protein SufE